MFTKRDPNDIAWVNVYNNSGEVIPAYAVMLVTDEGDDGYGTPLTTVGKPTVDSQVNILVNAPNDIPIGGYGVGHNHSACAILYDTGDGTPAQGESWGVGASSWKLRKGNIGAYVRATGLTSPDIVNVQHCYGRLFGVRVKESDGSPLVESHTIEFNQADGFALTNTAAGTVKVSFSGAGTDTKVKVTSNDTTADYLFNKLAAGTGITITETNDGGDEDATIAATVTSDNNTFTGTQIFSNDVTFNDVVLSNSVTWLQVVTLSSSQNNYSVGAGVTVLLINATANIAITGIAISGGNTSGRPLTIINVGAANTITLMNVSGSSSAANQLYLAGGSNLVLAAAGGSVQLSYGDASQWNSPGMAYHNLNTLATMSDLSANVLSMLGAANNAAILAAIGAQTLDATLTALAALTIAANTLTIGTGADAFSQTSFAANTFPARPSSGSLSAQTITDFGLSIVAAASNSALGAITWSVGTLAAAGSTQGDAASIVDNATNVSAADGTKGVILPATGGGIYLVYNQEAINTLKVYPPSGAQISANGTNTAESVIGTGKTTFIRLSSTQWYRLTTT